MKSFGKIPDLLIAFAATIILPRLSVQAANIVYPAINNIDPDKAFAWISIHHIALFLFTIVLMKLWPGNSLSSWGFNMNEYRLSLKISAWFCLAYLIPVFMFYSLPSLVSGTLPSFKYQINAKNISGVLSFQLFLSGSCEEPLSRGFVMMLLAQSWKKIYKLGKLEIPASGIWATLLFMFAHTGFNFKTLSFTSFSASQQIGIFLLGLYFAILFHKTKSLFGPILSHGLANGMVFVSLYITYFVMG